MTTIKEDYCSYEVAKLLKEKGFDEEVLAVHIYDKLFVKGENEIINTANVPIIPAPTHQMAMKWLREVHYIWISVFYGLGNKRFLKWEWELYNMIDDSLLGHTKSKEECCDTYEKAVEAAIKYCLENLI